MSVEKIVVDNKQELEEMITKDMSMIEKNLTVICNNVPINDKTTLDVLSHDSNGQLVLLQLGITEDDNMLLQGIQSLDYVNKFKSFLKVTYSKHNIDDQEKPRLILVAPSFSETMLHTVAHIQGIRIDLYEWEYLKIGDHKGLHLQSIFTWKSTDWKPAETPKEEKEPEKELKPVEKKSEPKPAKKKEPMPEKREETEPEPPKSEPDLPKEEPSISPAPIPAEAPEEEEPFWKRERETQQKKKRFF